MNKTFKLSALAFALAASAHVSAQEASTQSYDKWFGIYGMYYNADVDKPAPDYLDDGKGVLMKAGLFAVNLLH